jgi:hypothetical protein
MVPQGTLVVPCRLLTVVASSGGPQLAAVRSFLVPVELLSPTAGTPKRIPTDDRALPRPLHLSNPGTLLQGDARSLTNPSSRSTLSPYRSVTHVLAAPPSFPLTPSVMWLRGRERETRGCAHCCARNGVGEGASAESRLQRSLGSALVLALEMARECARSESVFAGVFAGAFEGRFAVQEADPAIDCGTTSGGAAALPLACPTTSLLSAAPFVSSLVQALVRSARQKQKS